MFRAPRRQSGGGVRSADLDRGPPRRQANVGFPDRIMARLSYHDMRRINPGGGATYLDTVYEVNNAFDPEYSGAGHQPRGFDSLAALYNRYRVYRTVADVEVRQRASHGVLGACVPNNVSTALTSADVPLELNRAVYIPVTGSSQPVSRVRTTIDMPAILGQTRAQYAANDNVMSLVTGNPNEPIYLHVYIAQVDGATALDVEISVTLQLEVEFFDRKFDSPSSIGREMAMLQAMYTPPEDGDDAASGAVVVPRPVAGGGQSAAQPQSAPLIRSSADPRRPAGRPG